MDKTLLQIQDNLESSKKRSNDQIVVNLFIGAGKKVLGVSL